MTSIIINADDCGQSKETNLKIEKYIIQRKITSTTVMANRDDLAGAINLYNKYSDFISFGAHLNLDSGHPLLYSQVMLDNQYIKEQDNGEMVFTGVVKKERNKRSNKYLQEDILKELLAQIDLLRDNGIKVSHIDSHHSIHCGIALMPIMPKLIDISKIYKVRRRFNVNCSLKYTVISALWNIYMAFMNNKIRTVDYMGTLYDFRNMLLSGNFNNGSYEFMVHPGIDSGLYKKENEFLDNLVVDEKFKMINYNQL